MVYKIIRMECQREYEVPMCRMYLIIQGIEIMEYEPYQAKSVNSHDHTIKFLSFIHKHLQIMIMKITIAY